MMDESRIENNEVSSHSTKRPYNTPTLTDLGKIYVVVQGSQNGGTDAGSHTS
jgi:hypothetical protein